ncbi:diguanylate cyclase domain-containing protein [Hephaestia sp. GCM10023244]|uniref:GGDEF domain-containing protein n=1 Tax=unclassified Hephaestia TaxID=2631281 RepID=UPI0020777C90|nr:diguanylate cyclase [Hephaestia sp. MAHUQ-44]MCM8729638.1 GGDEF domain-containing protein [Hephaestia sp. MAHUQ-44]
MALLFASLLLGAGSAHAQTGNAGIPIDTCVTRAAPGMSPRALFASPDQFDCTRRQTDWGAGTFWILSQPLAVSDQALDVRLASLWQDRVTLYALYTDGAIVRVVTDGHDATHGLQLGAIITQRLPMRVGVPVIRLLWHVEGAANLRGILLDPRVATATESAESNVHMAALYAGFAGLCIALFVYNLALWGALRHRFQLAYCAMMAALLAYSYSSSGALAWTFPDILNNDRLRINYLLLALSAACSVAFARSFFEPRVFSPAMVRACKATIAALMGSALLFLVLAPWRITLLDQLYVLAFVGLLLFAGAVMWRAWRTGSRYLWLFALAWAVPIALAGARVANGLDLIEWSFWIDNSTLAAMAAEALLSSLAIAYRIRLLSRERDAAIRQEVATRTLADTDPLTGLLNRRAFLREAIGRVGNQRLLLADLDYFKRVNDTIGHDGGDEVLCRFARVLRLTALEGTLIARMGGEEFAILSDADAGPAPEHILARLRIERMPFDLTITASIGASDGPLLTEPDWQQLYRAADRALLDAKSDGRDRARAAYSIVFAA